MARVPRMLRIVDDDASLGALLRSWPGLAVACLFMLAALYALVAWIARPDGWQARSSDVWIFLAAWPAATLAIGPVFWARFLMSSTPGKLRAVLWTITWSCVACPALFVVGWGVWRVSSGRG